MAGEARQPYIVVFADGAVGVPAQTLEAAGSGRTVPFRVQAMPAAMRAASVTQSRATTSGARVDDTDARDRSVDPNLVNSRVREIAARNRVTVDQVYSNALGGFSAHLTRAQLGALGRNPAVASIVPDEQVDLGDVLSDMEAGGVRTTGNPGAARAGRRAPRRSPSVGRHGRARRWSSQCRRGHPRHRHPARSPRPQRRRRLQLHQPQSQQMGRQQRPRHARGRHRRRTRQQHRCRRRRAPAHDSGRSRSSTAAATAPCHRSCAASTGSPPSASRARRAGRCSRWPT